MVLNKETETETNYKYFFHKFFLNSWKISFYQINKLDADQVCYEFWSLE